MKSKILLCALLLFPSISQATVNLTNGDFSIAYNDITRTDSIHDLPLCRVYNSFSDYNGWFGHGWGNVYETKLLVLPEGDVEIQEYGSGQHHYYSDPSKTNMQAGVDRIIAVVSKHEKLNTADIKTLRIKLASDLDTRRQYILKYNIQTLLSEGGKLRANECSDGKLVRIKDIYQRTTCDGYIDYFDLAGRLQRHEEADYFYNIHYSGKYPGTIEDSLGQKLLFKWNAGGHVSTIQSENDGMVVDYSYDERSNNTLSNTKGGNFYAYSYNKAQMMTKIGYIDSTHMDMTYNESGYITSVSNPDGSAEIYSYRYDPARPNQHFWVTTTKTTSNGERYSKEQEITIARTPKGVNFLSRIDSGEDITKRAVQLDSSGRVKRVNGPNGEFKEFFYSPTTKKLKAIVTDERSTVFTYDKSGNLIRAFNTNDQLIKLEYDSLKHITRMLECNGKGKIISQLAFKYNENGKPNVIKMRGKGEVNVKYDQNNEIVNVDAKGGAALALEITQAFRDLLVMVKDAGVTLDI